MFILPVLMSFSLPFQHGHRSVGAPLDGDWYAIQSHGCFAETAVYHFQGKDIFLCSQGAEVLFGSNHTTVIKGGLIQSEMTYEIFKELNSVKRNTVYCDKSDALMLASSALNNNPVMESKRNLRELGYRQRAHSTILGYVQSFWRASHVGKPHISLPQHSQ